MDAESRTDSLLHEYDELVGEYVEFMEDPAYSQAHRHRMNATHHKLVNLIKFIHTDLDLEVIASVIKRGDFMNEQEMINLLAVEQFMPKVVH